MAFMTIRNAIESCTVTTADGVQLHARVFKPTTQETNEVGTAIVLVHPYSKVGGRQALMQGIALRLSIKGYTAITFDMRGVGRSTGKSSLTGVAEVEDVIEVCRWASRKLPVKKILLVGSSAGAPIAGSAVDQVQEVFGYVGKGFPFGILTSVLFGRHHRAILQSPKPKLFVTGTKDGFTSVGQLQNKIKYAAGHVETHFIQGIGHFEMEGRAYDALMADLIVRFLATMHASSSCLITSLLLPDRRLEPATNIVCIKLTDYYADRTDPSDRIPERNQDWSNYHRTKNRDGIRQQCKKKSTIGKRIHCIIKLYTNACHPQQCKSYTSILIN